MVKIIVDSASDIEIDEAKKMGVELVPMVVRFGEEEFLDGVNIPKKVFFEKLIESNELPRTSLINTITFEEVFENAVKNGDDVIVITISSKLSGTYNSAKEASKKFKDKVFVIDSLSATAGERVLCDLAIRYVKEGKSAQEIVKILEEKKKKIQIIAMLDTLKYLKKGGRISSLVAFAGEMLMVKPVVSVVNGEVKLVGKAMGSKKANNLLTKLVNEKGVDFSMPHYALYSGLSDDLVKKYIEDSKVLWQDNASSIPIYMIGATVGTHIGPGAIGVVFFEK